MYGDLTEIKSIEHEIIQFLIFEKSEYIDCLNYGIDENIFFNLGFLKNNFDENLIIPNYFEPFVNQNIKIDVAIKCDFDDYIIFKADADQDRPNFIE